MKVRRQAKEKKIMIINNIKKETIQTPVTHNFNISTTTSRKIGNLRNENKEKPTKEIIHEIELPLAICSQPLEYNKTHLLQYRHHKQPSTTSDNNNNAETCQKQHCFPPARHTSHARAGGLLAAVLQTFRTRPLLDSTSCFVR